LKSRRRKDDTRRWDEHCGGRQSRMCMYSFLRCPPGLQVQHAADGGGTVAAAANAAAVAPSRDDAFRRRHLGRGRRDGDDGGTDRRRDLTARVSAVRAHAVAARAALGAVRERSRVRRRGARSEGRREGGMGTRRDWPSSAKRVLRVSVLAATMGPRAWATAEGIWAKCL